jgi:hypothetical protein
MIHELREGFIVKNLKLCEGDGGEWIDIEGDFYNKSFNRSTQKKDPEEFILQDPPLIIILHQIGKEEYLNSVLRY